LSVQHLMIGMAVQDSTSAKILMVGLYESEIGSSKAIGAGANGYLRLTCEPLDLIASLQRLAKSVL
jgi:hypothetical protein